MIEEWRFGIGQHALAELSEIRQAQHEGREADYMQAQRWRRMVEVETQRKRDAKGARSSRF